MALVAQLGDLLDVKNTTSEEGKRDGSTSLEAFSKVWSVVDESTCKDFVNVIGNHELYNFKRKELETRLSVVQDNQTWYSFKPWSDSPLR